MQNEKLIIESMYKIDRNTAHMDISKSNITNQEVLTMFSHFLKKVNGQLVKNKQELKFYVKLLENNGIRYENICNFLMYWMIHINHTTIHPEELEEMKDYCKAYLLKPLVNDHYRQCRWKHWVERRLS